MHNENEAKQGKLSVNEQANQINMVLKSATKNMYTRNKCDELKKQLKEMLADTVYHSKNSGFKQLKVICMAFDKYLTENKSQFKETFFFQEAKDHYPRINAGIEAAVFNALKNSWNIASKAKQDKILDSISTIPFLKEHEGKFKEWIKNGDQSEPDLDKQKDNLVIMLNMVINGNPTQNFLKIISCAQELLLSTYTSKEFGFRRLEAICRAIKAYIDVHGKKIACIPSENNISTPYKRIIYNLGENLKTALIRVWKISNADQRKNIESAIKDIPFLMNVQDAFIKQLPPNEVNLSLQTEQPLQPS